MKQKRILVVTQHYPPEIGAASNRIEHIVRHLGNSGFEVFLVTSQPSYPNSSLYSKQPFYMKNNKCRIYRIPTISVGKDQVITRIFHHLSFMIIALLLTLAIAFIYRIKICISTSPPFSVNVIGLIYKIFGWKRKWIMEVRDLWPDSMVAVGATRGDNPIFRLLKFMEMYFYRSASSIVVVTKSAKRFLIEQGVFREKISVITNGVPDWIDNKIKAPLIKNKASIDVLYAGNIGKSQNLKQLLVVAEHLTDFHFTIIGDGLERDSLKEYINNKELSNVTFIEAVLDKKDLAHWYMKADIAVISLKRAELFNYVIPSKIFEYVGFHLPILYIGQGEGAELIRKYQLGRVASAETQSIINELINIYNNIDYFKINTARKQFLSKYQWNNLSEQYIKLIHKNLPRGDAN